EHDLRGTINTGAIVAQIITYRLQEQEAQREAAETPQNLSHTARVAERDAIRAKSKGPYGYSV
ncbi:MAG: hypothetical protein HON42_01385, partial [Alphaproteobacteria bacterium]|nr:hypothetical protein [Alphaproteobacteria bacterium]MBT5827421.1 hypothetical protein [Alphaproteobacteria bacterium]